MLRTIKRAMVAVAVIAVAALAGPAMASAAPQWNTSATSAPGQAITGTGELTQVWMLGGTPRTITCDVAFEGGLWNGTDNGTTRGLGHITTFLLGNDIPGGGGCETSIEGCTMTITADTTPPWNLTAAAPADVNIGGINFTTTIGGGAGCPIDGVVISTTGSITGSVTPGLITFSNAGGLATPLGPVLVDGAVELLWEDDSSPVTLS